MYAAYAMINSMSKEKAKYFQSKYEKLRGSRDKELFAEARRVFKAYQKRRRQPYVRSKYFKKQKVFLSMFWKHLNEKLPSDRKRRIPFLQCALELLMKSTIEPETYIVDKVEYFRFYGKTKSGEIFAVQVMKDKKGNRYFMSCFPAK